jgi:4-hydroxy-3-methylbut-2-enyl diphosphate reductase
MIKKIHIAQHHGFCMGVKRAINIAEETAKEASPNDRVTILNEIVHNEAVVERFREEGVGQAFSVDDVEEGTLIISAHGIAPSVIERAEAKGLKVIDATCPLVTVIYDIIKKIVPKGYHVIHFGDLHHDETNGVIGYAPDRITVVPSVDDIAGLPDWKDRKLGLTVQTTAEMAKAEEFKTAAKQKWPHIEIFDTICNATNKRQSAILELAPRVDMILVVGSKSSANSNRLAKISDELCGNGRLIENYRDIEEEWFTENPDIEEVGISAGASTPDFLVEEVVNRLVEISGGTAEVVIPEKKKRRIRNIARSAG